MNASSVRRLAPFALGLLASCNSILGLEQRQYVAPVDEGCSTSLACEPGNFCADTVCTTTAPAVPSKLLCQVLEPQGVGGLSVENVDWSKQRHVLGGIFRLNNLGEVPRLEAFRLAVRQINDNQGIDASRRPLVFVACDYGGSGGDASGSAAQSVLEAGIDYLSEQLGARVIVAGSASSATKQALDHVTSKALPVALISSFSTSTTLTKYDDTINQEPPGLLWRTAPDDTQQAAVLATLIRNTPNVTNLGVLYIDDSYGGPLNSGVTQELSGTTVSVSSQPFPASEASEAGFATKLTTLFTVAPQADALLFVGTDGKMVIDAYQALAKSGRSGQVKALFLADAAKEAVSLLSMGVSTDVAALVARARGTAPYHATGEPYSTMKNDLLTAFSRNADDYSFVAQSYDAAFVAAAGLAWASASKPIFDGRDVAFGFGALSSTSPDRPNVFVGANGWPAARKALTDSSAARDVNLVGTSGALDFDADGQTSGPMEIWRVNAAKTGFETCAVCTTDKCDPSNCFQ